MSAAWTQLESLVVNGIYPLERCLGSTDHSAVYLSHATRHAPSAVALKLVRWNASTAQSLLARWRAAIELSHPQLVRLFEAGECELDGERYVFARMEYAELTLADVLEQRALTEGEARSMVEQTLDVLAYLHDDGRVHAGLKPTNFLVFGNELKLASDTVRPAQGADASAARAEDVRALAASLCEALTRVPPAGTQGTDDITLPSGLSAEFAPAIARCLNRDPRARPTVEQLQRWLRGESLAPAPEPAPSSPRLVIRVELPPDEPPDVLEVHQRQGEWRKGPIAIAALLLVGVIAIGYRALTRDDAPRRDPSPVAATPPAVAEPPPVADAAPVAPEPEATAPVRPEPVPAPSPPATASTEPTPGPSAAPVGEVLPTVSQGSLATITGTVRVAVRVNVDGAGKVVDASFRDRGPSRYFAQRSLDAAQKWTFPPADGPRSMILRFNFRRSGVTATSEPAP